MPKGIYKRVKKWKLSNETREKMSESRKKEWDSGKRDDCKDKISKTLTGRKRPEMTGDKHPMWKGGISPIRPHLMSQTEYKEWRRQVYKRDNYTCQRCGCNKSGSLNAHHIKEWAIYIDLRYDVSNGITLCKKCHIKLHKWIKLNK